MTFTIRAVYLFSFFFLLEYKILHFPLVASLNLNAQGATRLRIGVDFDYVTNSIG